MNRRILSAAAAACALLSATHAVRAQPQTTYPLNLAGQVQAQADAVAKAESIKGKLDTVHADIDFVKSILGEVQANPTGNTALDRLKQLKASVDVLNTDLGSAEASLASIDTKLSSQATAAGQATLHADLAALEALVGEVASSPTANTLADRLKSIQAKLDTLHTDLGLVATAAAQAAGNASLASIDTKATTLHTDLTTGQVHVDLTAVISAINALGSSGLATAAQIGEVQASPTANTVLDRLKAINTTAATLATATGQSSANSSLSTIATSTTGANTKLDTLHTDLGTVNTSINALGSSGLATAAQIGEVQASPTANTVLDRLKTINTTAATLATASGQSAAAATLSTIATNTTGANTRLDTLHADFGNLGTNGLFAFGFDVVDGNATKNPMLIGATDDGTATGLVKMARISTADGGIYVHSSNGAVESGGNLAGMKADLDTVVASLGNSGTVAGIETQGSAVTGGLLRTGCRAATTLPTAVADTAAADPMCSVEGRLAAQPAPNAFTIAGTANVATTSATTLIAAQGAGVKIVITSLVCWREDTGTTPIHVTFNDTVGLPFGLPAAGGFTLALPQPLQFASNTAAQMTLSSSVSGGNGYCSAVGYKTGG